MLIIRILENLLIIYFGLYLFIELSLVVIFMVVWRSKKHSPPRLDEFTPEEIGISILVPAYNEEVTIVDCVRMLGQVDYPYYEIIVISDGSQDRTLPELISAFELCPDSSSSQDQLGTQAITAQYSSQILKKLRVIEKRNGGKADALNVGLNLSQYPFVCTIDADSILDPQALRQVLSPFLETKGETIVATGGALAVANEARWNQARIDNPRLPRNGWVLFQLIEYLRSFLVSRTALSRVGGLLIMSGAFTLFRRQPLLAAGGFLSPYNRNPYVLNTCPPGAATVCEDLEIIVRIRRFLRRRKQKARVVYLPIPICWTEVPNRRRDLARQRNRWHRGLLETLKLHRDLLFEPRYGTLGLLALPYYFIFEALAPLIRLFAYLFIAVLLIFNLVNQTWLLLMLLAVTLLSAIVMGVITVIIEKWSVKHSPTNLLVMRYRSASDWLKLLGISIISDFTYAQLRLVWQLQGWWDFLKGYRAWDKFDRRGFHE